jgi:hypothetical protein
MKIEIVGFSGKRPRVSARLLNSNDAQIAKNCDLRSGEVKPLKTNSSVAATFTNGTIKTLHYFANQYWFGWTDIVKVARGPVAGDTSERTYWTGDSADGGKPKMGYSAFSVTGGPPYPAAYYRLGIPAPAAAPSLALGSGGGCDASVQSTRAYVYTYVTAIGEEGPPSAPTTIAAVCPGQTVDLSALSVGPGGPYNITLKNIYRSVTGTNGTEYQFVAQIAVGTATYSDTRTDAQLGEVLPSRNWTPPVDGLSRITELSNGMLAGFSGKDVWICEPFIPHGWHSRQSVNYDVVELCSYGTTLVVLTKGTPYMASGTDPSAITLEKLNFDQACVSARGTVRFGDSAVLYPSPDGLVMVSGSGASVVTEGYLTRDQWQAYQPDSIHAYVHDGRYIGFYDTGSVQAGFVFDPKQGGLGFLDLDLYATAGYVDPLTDSLYLMVSGSLVKWTGSTGNLTYTWKSKEFETPEPVCFSLCKVIARSYTALTAKIYANGVLKHTQTVASSNSFVLPAGYTGTVWEVEVSGTDYVTGIRLATSITEMRA